MRYRSASGSNSLDFDPFFKKLHPKYKTPHITILVYAAGAVIFIWTGNFMTFLMMSTFVGCLSEVTVCIALIVLRKKQPNLERSFKMWGYPVTAILATAITLILVFSVSTQEMISGGFLMLTSVPAYLIFLFTNKKMRTVAAES
ncbi:MAG: amino acid permease [Clostridiales bacterium]|nr:amino acid permease [Clostridiales bacterium]